MPGKSNLRCGKGRSPKGISLGQACLAEAGGVEGIQFKMWE